MKFKVGDVVVTKRCIHAGDGCGNQGPMGRECTIIRVDPDDPLGLIYETDIPYEGPYPFLHWWGCENCFEFKQPPKEAVGKWESCVWQPPTETVSCDEGK